MAVDTQTLTFADGSTALFRVAKDTNNVKAFGQMPVDANGQSLGVAANPLIVTQIGAAGITFAQSMALETSHLFKTTFGKLVSLYVQGNTVDCWLLVFDAIAVPVDGAVTPIDFCFCPAKAGGLIDWSTSPQPFANGLVVVLSSGANPFTKTTGPTGAFKGAYA